MEEIIDERMKVFRIIGQVRDYEVGKKPKQIVDDPFVKDFVRKNGYEDNNYVRINPRQVDIIPDLMKYHVAERFYVPKLYTDYMYDFMQITFGPYVVNSIVQTSAESQQEVLEKGADKSIGKIYNNLTGTSIIRNTGWSTYPYNVNKIISEYIGGCLFAEIVNDKVRINKRNFLNSPIGKQLLIEHWKKPTPTISTVCGKSEVKSPSDIRKEKKRAFIITDPVLAVNFGRYVNDFNKRLSDSNLKHPFFVGFNPWGCGWHRFYTSVPYNQKRWWSIDMKYQEATLGEDFSMLEFNFRWNMFHDVYKTREHRDRFKYYWKDNYHHLCWLMGMLWVKEWGNSSGNKITIQSNCFHDYCMHVYCFVRYCEERDLPIGIQQFNDLMKVFIQGDDALCCSPLDMIQVYSYAVEIGCLIKIEDVVPRYLKDCSFLSFTTYEMIHRGRRYYIPVLPSDKIRGSWLNGDVTCFRDHHQNTKVNSKRKSFIRTCGLMMNAFPHVNLYNEMKHYLSFLSQDVEVTGPGVDRAGLSWDDVRNAWFHNEQMIDLWIGETGKNLEYMPELKKYDYVNAFKCIKHGSNFKFDQAVKLSMYVGKTSVLDHIHSSTQEARDIQNERRRVTGRGSYVPDPGYLAKTFENLVLNPVIEAVEYVTDKFNGENSHKRTRELAELKRQPDYQNRPSEPIDDDALVESNPGPPKKVFTPQQIARYERRKAKRALKKAEKKVESKVVQKEIRKMGVTYTKPAENIKVNFKMNGPRRNNRNRNKKSNGNKQIVVPLSGTDLFPNFITGGEKAIIIAGTDTPGTVKMTFLLNPIGLMLPRLSGVAQWFSMCRCVFAAVKCRPGLGSNQKGSVIGYWDPDINDNPSTDPSLVTQNLEDAGAHRGSKIFGLNVDSMEWRMPKFGNGWYYTNQLSSDQRFTQQARFTLEVNNPLASTEDTANLGSVWFTWRYEFKDFQTKLPPSVSPVTDSVAIFNSVTGTYVPNDQFFKTTYSVDAYVKQTCPACQLTNYLTSSGYVINMYAPATYYYVLGMTATGFSPPHLSCNNGFGVEATIHAVRSVSAEPNSCYWFVIDLTATSVSVDNPYHLELENQSTSMTSYQLQVTSDPRPLNGNLERKNLKFKNPAIKMLYDELEKLKEKKEPLMKLDVQVYAKKTRKPSDASYIKIEQDWKDEEKK